MKTLTPRIALEIVAHEGIVREAYRDSTGVWTWSVGITNVSGHTVYPRYKDQPQPLEHCIGVFKWLLETRYLPAVLAAFGRHDPSEAELAAALSFHWNTGAIGRASWLRMLVEGNVAGARTAIMDWSHPASLTARRRREQALFFDGRWTNDGTALVYGVSKPSYRPAGARKVDIRAAISAAFADAAVATQPAAPAAQSAPQPQPPTPNWFDKLMGWG
jgi:lysozyme